jgi:hypothetical protein
MTLTKSPKRLSSKILKAKQSPQLIGIMIGEIINHGESRSSNIDIKINFSVIIIIIGGILETGNIDNNKTTTMIITAMIRMTVMTEIDMTEDLRDARRFIVQSVYKSL